MSHISETIKELHRELEPYGATLVAVSKFHPCEAIAEAYAAGQRVFGESRVQELLAKQKELTETQPALVSGEDPIRWHFIGHLQTNKVRQLMGRTALIESVDSEHLLSAIDTESLRAGTVTRVLLQVHVASEETKFGMLPDEFLNFFAERRFEALKATHICGIMGMASNTDDTERVRSDFRRIRSLFDRVRDDSSLGLRDFDTVSMGMSGDYRIALEEGSTLVRIGTSIFGPRQY